MGNDVQIKYLLLLIMMYRYTSESMEGVQARFLRSLNKPALMSFGIF